MKTKKEIEKVKRKLWSFGYSVKDITILPQNTYDLLVEGKKVKVGTKRPARLSEDYDIFALVQKKITFLIKADIHGTAEVKTATGVFGKVEKNK